MKSLSGFLGIVFAVSLTIPLSACSSLILDSGSDAAKATVINVSANYIRSTLTGKSASLNSLVLWDTFLSTDGSGVSRNDYVKQVLFLQTHWTPESHPLVKLDVLGAKVHGNDAEVRFQRRTGDGDYPEVWVKLRWSGSGWMVINDSIFGDDGFAASAMRDANSK